MSCENTSGANTNATSLSVTKDETFDANTKWLNMEPNDITSFAASLEKTARDPITQDRQRRKGTITSLTASPQFTADLTMDMVAYFMPSFMFSVWKGIQPESYETVDAIGASSTYTVETGGAVLEAGTLVYASGWSMPENNGLKTVASSTATTVVVNETLVDETASDSAKLYVVGVRGAAGDIQLDANGDLISTTLDFTTLGLYVGQSIHVGGQTTVNRFDTAGTFGQARIAAIETNKLTLERATDFAEDTGAGKEIDLVFSGFCRNVAVDDADFLKQFLHMEAAYDTTPVLYEYADCCIPNTLAINNALQDKVTVDLGFVGKDVPPPTDTPRDGTHEDQTRVEAFNTTRDITRLAVAGNLATGDTVFFKDTNISINNNVQSEYVLGKLPAEFINFGNFEVDIDTQVVFGNADILTAIRNNTSLSLEMAYQNNEGGFTLYMPSGTFGDGSKNFERNAKVKLTTPFMVERDETLGWSLGVSLFWYLPTA